MGAGTSAPEPEAAGASGLGHEAPGGSSAALEDNADTPTTITPAEATSTPYNNQPVAAENEPVVREADVEPEVEAPPEPVLEAANDNAASEELTATGTE